MAKIRDENGINIFASLRKQAVEAMRLPAKVWAIRLDKTVVIQDERGVKTGMPGDWIVFNEWGCAYVTSDLVFKQAFSLTPVISLADLPENKPGEAFTVEDGKLVAVKM